MLLTGGLPPLIQSPCAADDTYRHLYPRVIAQNLKFYKRFPGDVAKVQRIVTHLSKQPGGGLRLANGDNLTPRCLLQCAPVFPYCCIRMFRTIRSWRLGRLSSNDATLHSLSNRLHISSLLSVGLQMVPRTSNRCNVKVSRDVIVCGVVTRATDKMLGTTTWERLDSLTGCVPHLQIYHFAACLTTL